MPCSGTFGVSSPPSFTSAAALIALPLGQHAGFDVGDGVLVRFNQILRVQPMLNQSQVDALLVFTPLNWASAYSGAWIDNSTLLITVTR